MISNASKRATRALTLVLPALMLAGCFGNGEGPDPIAGTPAPPPPDIPPGFCDPINFEDLCGPFVFNEFEGGPVTIIDNPDAGGLNTTDKVARMQKFAAESGLTFGGSTLALPSGMDFTNGEAFTMLVWASRQVPVLFKFEGLGQERIVDHSGSGMWEELCFDFTGTTAGPAATGISFIFDVNVLGDAANDPDNWTFYFDEITQVASCGGTPPPGGSAPTTSAPTPTEDAGSVISLYSDAYTDVAVVWPTDWSVPNNTTSDVTIDGGLVKEALDISFFGIEFQVDGSSMTHLHLDVWTPDATSLILKLVDFGGDGFGGGNDTEGLLTFDAASTPALGQGAWISLDIPLQDFLANGLGSVADLNQIVVDPGPDGTDLYIDNVYFYDGNAGGGGGTAPTTSAPTPTQDAANVISLYSDAYTDVAVTWPTSWSVPNNTTSDVTIDGGLVKEALDISFFGIEFQVDGSSMTHLHLDVWTPDATSLILKLVDFGGDGFGGGNDTEGLLTFDAASTPALGQGAWISLDIPLQDFLANGLGSVADLNQIVVDPGPDGTDLYIDNVYFYDGNAGGGGGTAPTTSAPTPTQDAGSVISLYSDAYTDIAVTWPTSWSDPNNTTSDVTIDGGLVKEHVAINFIGVEFQVDATSMTHVHFDVWTPDATSLLFRLVDFGGDGFGGANADTSADVILDNASTPALAQGSWISVDIPLQTFLDNGLGSVADLNQIVLDPTADGSTVYIDNLYFYTDTPPTSPTTSAPTPTRDAGSVISLYSDAYADLATTWPTSWSDPNNTTSDVTIDGGQVKEHLAINFVGVEFQTDASSMTHVHFDVWTPDATSLLFRLVDFGGDGFGGANADTSGDVILDNASTPALTQGSWVSVDIPLQTFLDNGLGSVADLNQIVLDPTADGSTVYIDNVYFYDSNAGSGGGTFVNGDFETGDFTGWTLTQDPPGGGSITLDSSGQGGRAGTVARLVASGSDVAGFQNVVIGQVALGAGTIVPGDTIDVSFDLFGSLTGAGGVVFVEVIFLNAAGQDEGGRNFVGPAAPYTPTATWTTHSGTVIAGTAVNGSQWDVSGGVTLELKVACGAVVGGCGVDASFDNVTFTVNGP